MVLEGPVMEMAICTVTTEREGWQDSFSTWGCLDMAGTITHTNKDNNVGLVSGMQAIYKMSDGLDILAYFHDDVICREQGWAARVLKQFEDPKVGVVGFGGSLWHGSPDIYKVPYHISQLGRSYYMSNVDDAEVHGERFKGTRECATLDGFALCIRRELLLRAGGWPVDHLKFHGYDHWTTLIANRLGYRVSIVGIRSHHLGGQTYTKLNPDPEDHARAHKWLYEEFRDVLPVMVRE